MDDIPVAHESVYMKNCTVAVAMEVALAVAETCDRVRTPLTNQKATALFSAATSASCVMIDDSDQKSLCGCSVIAYRDLAADSNLHTAMQNLFSCLRWTEQFSEAGSRGGTTTADVIQTKPVRTVLLADVSEIVKGTEKENAAAGLADRMYRAASGRRIFLETQHSCHT